MLLKLTLVFALRSVMWDLRIGGFIGASYL
jgi:hypothetical protein